MKLKRISTAFLILGVAFLAIALIADQPTFSWVAAGFVLVSMILGAGRLRRRRKKIGRN